MKSFILIMLFLMVGVLSAQSPNPKYDAELAKELEADDYGMKQYVLVMLKTGSNSSEDSLRTVSFNGHMENMNRLVEDNKLVIAGPIAENNNEYRGIFILNLSSIDEAHEILKTDPAISNNYLDYDLYSWYGSAALPVYLEASEKVAKYDF